MPCTEVLNFIEAKKSIRIALAKIRAELRLFGSIAHKAPFPVISDEEIEAELKSIEAERASIVAGANSDKLRAA